MSVTPNANLNLRFFLSAIGRGPGRSRPASLTHRTDGSLTFRGVVVFGGSRSCKNDATTLRLLKRELAPKQSAGERRQKKQKPHGGYVLCFCSSASANLRQRPKRRGSRLFDLFGFGWCVPPFQWAAGLTSPAPGCGPGDVLAGALRASACGARRQGGLRRQGGHRQATAASAGGSWLRQPRRWTEQQQHGSGHGGVAWVGCAGAVDSSSATWWRRPAAQRSGLRHPGPAVV